jgi:thioredoxin-related protein
MRHSSILFIMLLFLSRLTHGAEPKVINWLTNYESAVAQAKTEKKLVLLFFHGSDWCPPCIKMQKEVFDNNGFIAFASQKLVFLDVDFPYKNKLSDAQLKHNNALKKQFGLPEEFTQGYPQVVIIDDSGKVLYQEKGYNGEGPQKLTGIINEIIE